MWWSCDYLIDPGGDGVEKFDEDVRIFAAAFGGEMEGMIRFGKKFEGGERFEVRAEGLHERQVREVVACALQEKHGDWDVGKMCRSIAGWFAGWMEWKADEHQTANSG